MEHNFNRPIIQFFENVQPQLRNAFDVVVVDQQTAEEKNPLLRDESSTHLRVVVGKLSTMNLKLQIFTDAYKRSTMIVTTDIEARNNQNIVRFLESNGIALLALKKNDDDSVDLLSMIRTFSSLKIKSILIEDSQKLAEKIKNII